jgi:hypothetical protein
MKAPFKIYNVDEDFDDTPELQVATVWKVTDQYWWIRCKDGWLAFQCRSRVGIGEYETDPHRAWATYVEARRAAVKKAQAILDATAIAYARWNTKKRNSK